MNNEELLQLVREQEREIEGLKEKVLSLEASSTISRAVEVAFRQRLNIASFTPTTGSSKSASSENQAVNEGGSASYSVLKPPDAFLQIVIANTTYYIPVFT